MKTERLLELAGVVTEAAGLSADETAALKDAVLNTHQELESSGEDQDAKVLKSAAKKAGLWG